MTADLRALSSRFMEAVRDRELGWLEAHLADEFTLTTGRPRSPVRGRDEWLEVTARRYVIEEFEFEELDTIDLGSAAVVRSRYRQRGSMDGDSRTQMYLMTDLWAERDGRPQLVTDTYRPWRTPLSPIRDRRR